MHASYPAHVILYDVITLKYLVKNTNYELCNFLFTFLLLPPS
jgi:hypothetical protein